jgi:metal-responsive CopG/Arc/MetJ family transcriptional regulator
VSTTTDGKDDDLSISVRVDRELLDNFDRARSRAEWEGVVPTNTTRSEAIRMYIRAVADDPDVLKEFADEPADE